MIFVQIAETIKTLLQMKKQQAVTNGNVPNADWLTQITPALAPAAIQNIKTNNYSNILPAASR